MTTQHSDQGAKDLFGGLFLIVTGLAFALGAWFKYPLGTLVDMGPGMFPLSLGLLLAALGALIALPAVRRVGRWRLGVDWRALLTISCGTLAFILTLERFGLAVAVLSLTWLSALAVNRLSLMQSIGLGLVLTVAVMLIFVYGLGVPTPLFAWKL